MLKEKVVIMTGAAGGIGQATAYLFAQNGANLVLTDIERNRLEELGRNLDGFKAKVALIEHDVTDPESWQSLVQRVRKEYGQIDVLLNIAGVVQPRISDKATLDEIQRQVSVNLLGTIYGCRAVLAVMKEQNFGKIVNIASLGGIVPMPGEAIYCSTKYAIRGYSLSLRAELYNSPISVTVVCPDSVNTPQLDYELLHDEAVLSFIGKPLKPERVAKAILKAVEKKTPEIVVPAGMGFFCRIGMAFPRLFFLLLPFLEKLGRSTMKRRRAEKEKRRDVHERRLV
jgi:3-oxoacyl-[acyl-carrier protein] reductase